MLPSAVKCCKYLFLNDSKSDGGDPMPVRVRPSVPSKDKGLAPQG